jgi:hypothetical protein
MDMRKISLLVVALAALVPAAAGAQVSLGLRLGFAPSMGDAVKDGKMSDGVKSQIPIQVDALYKLDKNLALGGYFSYGLGQLGGEIADLCDASGADCSATSMRAGVQLQYALDAKGAWVPWGGIGAGYEWGKLSMDPGSVSYRGFEFLNLQVGGDYKVNERFSIGPYAQFSMGQYSNATMDDGTDSTSDSIDEKGIHEWFGVGLRGNFSL